MSFIGEILEEVVGGGGGGGGGGNNYDRRDEGAVDPPYVQPPWVTRWDQAGRWIFINEQTGEHSFERPIFEEAAEDFGREEQHMEQRFDNGVQDVEEFPEDHVEYDVDRAEDKVEDGWDNTVDAVEDAPENLAEWVGEGVGRVEHAGDEVENFGDEIEGSYDQGRNEERYDY
ncbi:unnamed protein product [Discula destructiva]